MVYIFWHKMLGCYIKTSNRGLVNLAKCQMVAFLAARGICNFERKKQPNSIGYCLVAHRHCLIWVGSLKVLNNKGTLST